VVDLKWTRWRTCLPVRHCTGDKLMCNGNTESWFCEEVCSVSRFLWGLGRYRVICLVVVFTGKPTLYEHALYNQLTQTTQ